MQTQHNDTSKRDGHGDICDRHEDTKDETQRQEQDWLERELT